MFAIPRCALVIADGPFAEVAWEHGAEVVTLGGLDRPALAVLAAGSGRATFVPLHTDRPARGVPRDRDVDRGRPRSEAVADEPAALTGADSDLDLTGPDAPLAGGM